jgi:hypothetical protein
MYVHFTGLLEGKEGGSLLDWGGGGDPSRADSKKVTVMWFRGAIEMLYVYPKGSLILSTE